MIGKGDKYMRKIFSSVILASLLVVGTSVDALGSEEPSTDSYAKDSRIMEGTEKTVYEISDLNSVTIDENGNPVENEISLFSWGINGSHIEPGQTKYYFPSNIPEGFPIAAYQVMEVNLSWGRDTSIEIGLEDGPHFTQSGTGTRIFLYSYSSGNHKLYIKNLGNSAIDVNGTIEY